MYVHGRVGFRPIEQADLELLRQLHNNVSTLLQLGNVDFIDSEQQIAWWQTLHKSANSWRFSVVEVATGEVVGMIRVQNIERVNRTCEVGLDIAERCRGRGLATEAYAALLEYLFLHYHMHMVYLRVGDFNSKARRLYEKLHFEETGRFKEYLFRNGKYWDYVVMCLTVDRYMQCTGRQL